MDWYDTLKKSPLTPPDITFSIVWPILYLLMFVGFIRILTVTNNSMTILIFIAQLLLNIIWSPIFFRWHNIQLSFIVICLLLINATIMTYNFYTYDQLSGLMQLPYILWLLFATYLNWYILANNVNNFQSIGK